VVLGLADGSEVRAARVLWTAPLEPLAAAADAPPGLAGGTRHRALVLVYLVVAAPRYTAFDAHYVPDADVAFSRLSEPKNYRDGPDPAGTTVLCAEVPCTVGDRTWCTGPDDLRARVVDGMVRCGLPEPVVAEVAVRRLPRVYPLVTPGEEPARRRLLAWAEGLAGVTVLGRQGLLVADNLHHVLDMGLSAGACAGPDGRWDETTWALHRSRFDSFVVDD
jgi:protoporphyrinogen oxidase